MKGSMYFNGFAILHLLTAFIVEDLFAKYMLMIVAFVYLILGWFMFRSEAKLDNIKFKLKMLKDDMKLIRHEQITNLLGDILKNIREGKNGIQRNSRRSKPKRR